MLKADNSLQYFVVKSLHMKGSVILKIFLRYWISIKIFTYTYLPYQFLVVL